jgi:hypothetical protein
MHTAAPRARRSQTDQAHRAAERHSTPAARSSRAMARRKSHDPVARVLIDGVLEVVNAVRENLKKRSASVPLFCVDRLGELHRVLRSTNRTVTRLRSPSAQTSRQDLVDQILRRVRAGRARAARPPRPR